MAFERIGQLAAECEDLVGIAEYLVAGLGEHDGTALAFEQLSTEGLFQLLKLAAKSWLGQVKFRGSSGDAPFFVTVQK